MRLLKPSSYARLVNKNARRLAKERAKRIERDQEAFIWQTVRMAVYTRDGGRCRVCGVTLRFRAANKLNAAHTHHLKYRSAGGSDALANLITICPKDHDLEHRHLMRITGTADAIRVERLS